ncbi:MAG TPA: hypothetical protein VHM19_08260 [Polyangiales bacterium]|nr:hypothetical protein [Polyangiales bacterium]
MNVDVNVHVNVDVIAPRGRDRATCARHVIVDDGKGREEKKVSRTGRLLLSISVDHGHVARSRGAITATAT